MNIPFSQLQSKAILLDGGIDLTSSNLAMSPGLVTSGSNLEMVAGVVGYSRLGGYERCCDDNIPSATSVYYLVINTVTDDITDGDTFTCSGDTLRAISDITSPVDGDVLVVATHDGEPAADSIWLKSGNAFTVTSILSDTSGYTTGELSDNVIKAVEQTRTAIDNIPGSGNVEGGFRHKGYNYVFRNGVMYKGLNNVWTEVVMPDVMYFSNGTVELLVGDSISDGTRTATIASITVQGGAWDSGAAPADQAHGYLTLTSASGEFTLSANIVKVGVAGTRAVVASVNSEYVITSGGKYETKEYNFTNVSNNSSIYGVNGKNSAFQFDGTNYIPIYNPSATTDTPHKINIHQERLQLGYPGGQMAYSVSGQPRVYNALLGSGTYSTGSEITGITTIHGNAAAIGCEDGLWFLIGDGIYDDATATRNWQFYEHGDRIDCAEHTMVGEDQVYFVSNTKIRRIRATDTGAIYDAQHICKQIQPYLESNRGEALTSLWAKEKSQYRVFFDGGSGISITIDEGSIRGAFPFSLPIPVNNVWSTVEEGKELIFFTSDDDYLYRLDSGNSFDGDYITGSFRIPFHSYGSPRTNKRFPQIILELNVPILLSGNTEITATINFAYGSSSAPTPTPKTITEIESGGGIYGNNDGFGNFIFGGVAVSEIHAYIDGYGQNMSILITFKTKNDNSFTFRSAIVDYRNIGVKRQQ